MASVMSAALPMTQGKIERWHQTLKNRILRENYYLPGDLEAQIEAFVADYNHRCYHESIGTNPGRRLLRKQPDNPVAERNDQTKNHRLTSLPASATSRVTSSSRRAIASLNLRCSLSQLTMDTQEPDAAEEAIVGLAVVQPVFGQ